MNWERPISITRLVLMAWNSHSCMCMDFTVQQNRVVPAVSCAISFMNGRYDRPDRYVINRIYTLQKAWLHIMRGSAAMWVIMCHARRPEALLICVTNATMNGPVTWSSRRGAARVEHCAIHQRDTIRKCALIQKLTGSQLSRILTGKKTRKKKLCFEKNPQSSQQMR